MKVREPVARPLDIVAVELLLSAAQAFLAGVLLYLAAGLWEDRGVELGSVAAVLVLMGLATGAAWAYWLFGGTGWLMAGINAASAVFLGALLVLTWSGEAFRVGGVPLLLASAAAAFGAVAGVFLDSPRRWRWDQRERLRPGTQVPRVSPATRTLVEQVPRSLPRRRPRPEPVSELAARIGASTPQSPGSVGRETAVAVAEPGSPTAPPEEPERESALTDAPEVEGTPLEVPEAPEPVMPTPRLGRAAGSRSAKAEADEADDEAAAKTASDIELPTMLEPKAQRSPWAWAAPPEWNRDEDDGPGSGSSSGRT